MIWRLTLSRCYDLRCLRLSRCGFLVGTFYRPDCSSKYYDKDFMVKFNNMLHIAAAENKELIVLGDFNCCFMPNKRKSTDYEKLKALFKYLDFKHLISSPTRITQASKSLIDIIATSCPENISNSGVISSQLSDHELVYCVRMINWQRASCQMKTFRNYARYSSGFCEDLKGIWNNKNTPSGNTTNCVWQLWCDFKNVFVSVPDRHASLIQTCTRGR